MVRTAGPFSFDKEGTWYRGISPGDPWTDEDFDVQLTVEMKAVQSWLDKKMRK